MKWNEPIANTGDTDSTFRSQSLGKLSWWKMNQLKSAAWQTVRNAVDQTNYTNGLYLASVKGFLLLGGMSSTTASSSQETDWVIWNQSNKILYQGGQYVFLQMHIGFLLWLDF